MTSEATLVLCYHRGCGLKFDPSQNKKDSCRFHPGVPIFHDAYKSWSCCKKKSTDFTEFLNYPGCTLDFHSNEKPPEPVKPPVDKEKASEVIIVRAPETPKLPRPPLDTMMTLITPSVADGLLRQVNELKIDTAAVNTSEEIKIGTICKRGGCKKEFKGVESNEEVCVYHPGVPIFHEGMKYWSCCNRKTTDFEVFLEQAGCEKGGHLWIDEKNSTKEPSCRYDWHQTGSQVIVSVYAKKYDPNESSVELNPIRIKVNLFFPEENNFFKLDEELRGVIDVKKSEVSMMASKVEIRLRKAEPGTWTHLTYPKVKKETPNNKKEEKSFDDASVDLGDLLEK